jgi:predicted dehydrogenase
VTVRRLDTVVIGYGQAARRFHLPAVPDLVAAGHASGRTTVVDPAGAPADDERPVYPALVEAPPGFDGVVHVCTPPDTHADLVVMAVELGYRRFVVEKPMTTTARDARRLVELGERCEAEILVVANWTASALTAEIARLIRARPHGAVHRMALTQCKPRFERTAANDSHRSAFDVEMPHLVALALSLVDSPVELVGAASTDLLLAGKRYPEMGSAELTLRTSDGVPVWLRSDLTAPWRERSVLVEWSDGSRLVGFHPCDSSDRYSQLVTTGEDGRQQRRLLHDDTVRRFLRGAYAYFAGAGPRPASTAAFGAAITDIISAARSVAASTPAPSGTEPDLAQGNRGRT